MNAPNQHSKSNPQSIKKKGAVGGQNHHNSNKFGHPHGNVANNNLRAPPPSSNKMPAGAQMNGGKMPKEMGANNNSKGKVTTMKAHLPIMLLSKDMDKTWKIIDISRSNRQSKK